MRILTVGGLLVLAVTAFPDEVDLRATPAGRVSLKVGSAPLSVVLDRLARQTGMKVIYDGAPPRTVVRGRQIEDVTPAEAVADVLEGLGVSYALRLDATGAKVDTLLVLSLSATKSGAGPTPRPAVPPVRLPGLANLPVPQDEDSDDDVPSERPEEIPAEGRPQRGEEKPDITRPMGMPGPMGGIPGQMGIPGVTVPTLPVSPIINPLTLPTPGPVPSPTPPPQ
jgi:hypothetical protein